MGSSALLIECADGAEVEAWRAELWRRRAAGELAAVEIVPGARTVLLDGLADPDGDGRAGRRLGAAAAGRRRRAARSSTIPVVYDGPDLIDVAERWGVSVPTRSPGIAGAELRVAFCGFAPGFAYLTGLPASGRCPGWTRPRPGCRPARSALAGAVRRHLSDRARRAAGGSSAAPTLSLFDVDRDPPALLAPGTRVRLAARVIEVRRAPGR